MVANIDGLYAKTRPTKALSRFVSYAFFEGRPLTTRGRWINPAVFFLLRVQSRLPQLKSVVKPIFIIGTGRSGSTVLGKVLSMHRDIGFLNEPKAIWHTVYPHEDVIGSFSNAAAKYSLAAEDVTDRARRTAHRIYGAYLALVLARRVVDKYPELVFRVPFVRAIFPDAKFIFLVRNGLDTCSSISDWSVRHGETSRGATEDWWGKDGRKWRLLIEQILPQHELLHPAEKAIRGFETHTDMAAVEWVLAMDRGLRVLAQMPDDVHMVRYEELTREPAETLETILDFCELRNDPKCLDYARKVLRPGLSGRAVRVPDSIGAAFSQTMSALGYS